MNPKKIKIKKISYALALKQIYKEKLMYYIGLDLDLERKYGY